MHGHMETKEEQPFTGVMQNKILQGDLQMVCMGNLIKEPL